MLFELNAQHSRESQQIMLSKLVLLGALGATHAFVPTNTARVARVILEADVAVEGDTAEPPSAAAVAGVAPNDPGTLSCFVDNQARTLDVATMPGAIPPVGLWDPLGLSKDLSDNELRWYRAAEIKHGRVCMLAFTGWWVQNVCHVTFAGKIASSGTTFKDLDGMDIMKEWDSVPEDGRLQIITTIGLLEFFAEARSKPHYVFQGSPNDPTISTSSGYWPFNAEKFGYQKLVENPEKFRKQQNKEIQNGRLAMLGTASLFAAHYYPGSVPILSGITI